jgi:ATP-binding cassette subfamily B protein/subfamily B ATP-binding cassette protein MsbA
MNSFARFARMALRYRWTVVSSVLCSLGIAFLWAFNFSAFMPVVDGVMHGKAIPALIDDHVASTLKQIADIDVEIAACQKQLKIADEAVLRSKLTSLEDQRANKERWRGVLDRAQPLATRWLPATPFGTLLLISAFLVASTLVKSVLRIINSRLVAMLGNLTSLELRKEFYRRTLRLDLGTFRQTSNGELMSRFTTDMEWVGLGTQVLYGIGILEPLKMLACLIGAGMISWQLLLLTMISAPPGAFAIHWLAKALKRANRKALQELSIVYDHLEESFDGIKVIKAFTMESHERSRFHRLSRQYYRRSMKIALYDSLVSPFGEIMGLAMIVAVVTAGGYLASHRGTLGSHDPTQVSREP